MSPGVLTGADKHLRCISKFARRARLIYIDRRLHTRAVHREQRHPSDGDRTEGSEDRPGRNPDARRHRDQHAGFHCDAVKEQAIIYKQFSRRLMILIALVGSAFAQHERQFNFYGANGAAPDGGVVFDTSGNLYGETYNGGSNKVGVVYELSPAANGVSETVLYSFTGTNGDGMNPIGGLVIDGLGNLYGVTQLGGMFNGGRCQNGCGVVFELSQAGGAWTETILHTFQGDPSDGANPVGGLTFDGAGNLYGTTANGGAQNAQCPCGTVFELSPPSQSGGAWIETILYVFQGIPDGIQPMAGVILDSTGHLYGTTYNGGLYSNGTVFELSPPSAGGGAWTETILHDLFISTDGDQPMANLTMSGGALYGTTTDGGPMNGDGTVFRLLPPSLGGSWTFELVHVFVNQCCARGPVTFEGPNTLYGPLNSGIVYQIANSVGGPVYTIVYDGAAGLSGPLNIHNYALYGTSEIGGQGRGCTGGCGFVYELSH